VSSDVANLDGMRMNMNVFVYCMRVYVCRRIHVCVCAPDAMSSGNADLNGTRININVCVYCMREYMLHMCMDL